MGQVGGFKVSRQDALDLVGQAATQGKEGEGGHRVGKILGRAGGRGGDPVNFVVQTGW